jgi:hypothetical protein
MTQQMQREVIALAAATLVFARSIYPKPILNRAIKEPYKSQVVARFCYALFGIFALLVWYGIYREGH